MEWLPEFGGRGNVDYIVKFAQVLKLKPKMLLFTPVMHVNGPAFS